MNWGPQPLAGYRHRPAPPAARRRVEREDADTGFAPSSSFGPSAQQALAHVLTRSVGAPLYGGNGVALLDGVAEATLAALGRARLHANLETGALAQPDAAAADRLVDALLERRRAGVRVHLIATQGQPADAATARRLQALRAADVRIAEAGAAPGGGWPALLPRWAQADASCELAVIDGRSAVIGHDADAGWRGCRLGVEGPAVAALQAHFLARWQQHTGEALPRLQHCPPLAPAGSQRIGIADDAVWGRRRHAYYELLLAAVEAARERVLIACDACVPTRRWQSALAGAARRGVEVRLLLAAPPAAADDPIVLPLAAGPAHWQRLQAAGVQLHHRPAPGRAQAAPSATGTAGRVAIVDGVWAAPLGGRLDWRSFLPAAGGGAAPCLVVLDAGLAGTLEARFRADAAAAVAV